MNARDKREKLGPVNRSNGTFFLNRFMVNEGIHYIKHDFIQMLTVISV